MILAALFCTMQMLRLNEPDACFGYQLGILIIAAQIDSVYCAAFGMIEISGVCGISMPVPR